MYRPWTFFRENLQKIISDPSENFYVSVGTITSCVCLLKSQRFAQFLCHSMWPSWFNILVNDMSVFKNVTRFCFSVPYVLCIEKKYNDRKSKKKNPQQFAANTQTHTHTHIYIYIIYYFDLNTVKDTFVQQKLLVIVVLHT